MSKDRLFIIAVFLRVTTKPSLAWPIGNGLIASYTSLQSVKLKANQFKATMSTGTGSTVIARIK